MDITTVIIVILCASIGLCTFAVLHAIWMKWKIEDEMEDRE